MCFSILCVIIAIIVQFRTSKCAKSDLICDDVLAADRFDPLSAWNSTNCQLHYYTYADVAECFIRMPANIQLNGKRFHVVFAGDSRIRSAFHSFWPTLPNYDLTWKGDVVDRKFRSYHHDIEIDSAILNTRVTFLWRPTINKGLQEFLNWRSESGQVPSLLITGFGSHHMGHPQPLSYLIYKNEMAKLVAVLRSLASKMPIIWWHQNPIIETYGNKSNGVAIGRVASNTKYKHYNSWAQRLLRDTGVIYWQSSYSMAEEYIRSCAINDRTDVTNVRSCFDYIHTGYVIYDHGTQVLLNAICNRLLHQSSNPSILFNSDTCCTRL